MNKKSFFLLLFNLVGLITYASVDTLKICIAAVKMHIGAEPNSVNVKSIYLNDSCKSFYVTGFNSKERQFFFGKKRIEIINEDSVSKILSKENNNRQILLKVFLEKMADNYYKISISDFVIKKEGESIMQLYTHGVQYYFKKNNKGMYNFIKSIDVSF